MERIKILKVVINAWREALFCCGSFIESVDGMGVELLGYWQLAGIEFLKEFSEFEAFKENFGFLRILCYLNLNSPSVLKKVRGASRNL